MRVFQRKMQTALMQQVWKGWVKTVNKGFFYVTTNDCNACVLLYSCCINSQTPRDKSVEFRSRQFARQG
jgi:hypothetical protein